MRSWHHEIKYCVKPELQVYRLRIGVYTTKQPLRRMTFSPVDHRGMRMKIVVGTRSRGPWMLLHVHYKLAKGPRALRRGRGLNPSPGGPGRGSNFAPYRALLRS
jgi:hypothetical protein